MCMAIPKQARRIEVLPLPVTQEKQVRRPAIKFTKLRMVASGFLVLYGVYLILGGAEQFPLWDRLNLAAFLSNENC